MPSSQKSVFFRVTISEERSSLTSSFLEKPLLSVQTLVSRLCTSLSKQPDTCFRLADGAVLAHELLLGSNEHFKSLFNDGYSESRVYKVPDLAKLRNRDLGAEELTGKTLEDLGSDSDIDEQRDQGQSRGQWDATMKIVELPNFS